MAIVALGTQDDQLQMDRHPGQIAVAPSEWSQTAHTTTNSSTTHKSYMRRGADPNRSGVARGATMGGSIAAAAAAELNSILLDSDTPVLIDFWVPWCELCIEMLPTLEEIAEAYSGDLKIARVNIQEDPTIVQRFNTRTIPLLVFFRGGTEAARAIGTMSTTRLCAFIDKHLMVS